MLTTIEAEGIELIEGKNGLPMVRVNVPAGEAEVYLHGAHVTSFLPRHRQPVLFTSSDAVFDGKKPIRGGLPICFPWFGGNGPADDSPSHGFARTASWNLIGATRDGDEALLLFRLDSDDATRQLWPHDFRFDFQVRVGSQLIMTATVTNTGDAAFNYELALHTYFAVSDVAKVGLAGFDGCDYVDQLDGNTTKTQQGEPTIAGEIDRIYQNHTSDVTIHDGDRTLTVAKTGSKSTVLWNPHVAKAKRLSDLGDHDWPVMLCVESAAIGEQSIRLEPRESHAVGVTFS
jgi:D-hexose-6-phosphate mutarotase